MTTTANMLLEDDGRKLFSFFCKLVSDSPVSIIKTNVDSRNLLQIQVLVFGRTGRAVWG